MNWAIAAGGVTLSILTTISIASFRLGVYREQIAELRMKQEKMATKEDLTPIKESLAEIKGMFRLELKER